MVRINSEKLILNDDNQVMFITMKEYKYLLKCQTLAELIYENCTPKEIKKFIKSKTIEKEIVENNV